MNVLLQLARIIKVFTFLPCSIFGIIGKLKGINDVNKIPVVSDRDETIVVEKEKEPMNPIRSGLFTTEFITMIVAQAVSLLVMSGKISAVDADPMIKAISDIFAALLSIVTAVTYIITRTSLKKSMMENLVVKTDFVQTENCPETTIPDQQLVDTVKTGEVEATGTPNQN
jgi:hypothetical protein